MAASLNMAGNATVQLREALLHEINQVIDPCSISTALPAGLVDMGLLRELRIEELAAGFHVEVKLCTTHAFCMMPAIFVHEVEKRLRAQPSVASFDVSLDGTTLWTEESMSADYRRRLAAQRIRKRLE